MNKKDKEDLNKICECGHRRGEHTYFQGSYCTKVISCNCKYFKEKSEGKMTAEKEVQWIIDNWKIIPDKFKSDLKPNNYKENIKDLSLEKHFVVLLLDRQKPSVISSYDFDEERIGVTREGKVVWGFDSGCSCPSPWDDSFPNCYNVSKSWKEFAINLKDFDKEVIEECLKIIENIKLNVEAKK